jgi:hypothetical protein
VDSHEIVYDRASRDSLYESRRHRRRRGGFDVVDSFTDTVEADGRELTRCLEIDRVFSLLSGETAFAGRAAVEYVRQRETAEIVDGEIRVEERPRTAVRHTEFAGVPGEFVVVEGGGGTFAFELVGADTAEAVERATVDLDAFYDRHEAGRPWKAGFFGDGDDAVTGVLHGEDVRASSDLADVLERSRLNQLGLAYEYGGRDLDVTAARSGYVEVYRPRDFDTADYLGYLRDEIPPHAE